MPEFRSLASILMAPAGDPVAVTVAEAPCVQSVMQESPAGDERLREAAHFFANLREELESAVERLCEGIARDVLVRELLVRPADISALIDRACAEYASLEPLRVRVCPGQAQLLSTALPIYVDESLQDGDAVLELRTGFVDLRLQTRFDDVMCAVRR